VIDAAKPMFCSGSRSLAHPIEKNQLLPIPNLCRQRIWWRKGRGPYRRNPLRRRRRRRAPVFRNPENEIMPVGNADLIERLSDTFVDGWACQNRTEVWRNQSAYLIPFRSKMWEKTAR